LNGFLTVFCRNEKKFYGFERFLKKLIFELKMGVKKSSSRPEKRSEIPGTNISILNHRDGLRHKFERLKYKIQNENQRLAL